MARAYARPGGSTRYEISRFLEHFDTDADREKFCSGNATTLFDLSR